MFNAILIPVEGPMQRVTLSAENSLKELQGHVGGYIEAVPLPNALMPNAGRATAYIHEEGKFSGAGTNMAATDFLVPGVGLFMGDYIAGPMLVVGFDSDTGEHTEDLPHDVRARLELIASESGRGIASAQPTA